MVSFNPATRFLIECIRLQLNPGNANRLQELNIQPHDAQQLLQEARYHKVVPALGLGLRNYYGKNIPQALRDEVEDRCNSIREKNARFIAELMRLLNAFNAKGLEAIPYKGPALIEYYPDSASRQFYDLDFIIHKKDIPAAVQFITDRGYEPKTPNEIKQLNKTLKYNNTVDFVHASLSTEVDFHWTMTKSYYQLRLNMDELWQRTSVQSFYGINTRVLRPEDLLLTTVVHHGIRNGWKKLVYLSDLAHLVQHCPDLDWKGLLLTAKKEKVYIALYVGLALTRHLFDIRLPENLSAMIEKDTAVQRICAQSGRLLSGKVNNLQRAWLSVMVKMNMREGWLTRKKIFLRELGILAVYLTERFRK